MATRLMDLRLTRNAPSTAERAAVDAVLGPPASSWEGAARGQRRSRRSWRPRRARAAAPAAAGAARAPGPGRLDQPGALDYICRRLTVPPAEAYGVATFYALFALEPRAPVVVHVCTTSPACAAARPSCVAELERTVGPAGAASRRTAPSIWLREPLPGPVRAGAGRAGHRRPAQTRAEHAIARGQRAPTVAAALAGARCAEPMRAGRRAPQVGEPTLRLLRRVGQRRPGRASTSYRADGGYAALRRGARAGPGRRHPRGDRRRSCSAAAAPRSRPAASGRRSREARCARTTWSATPTSPSPARSRTGC